MNQAGSNGTSATGANIWQRAVITRIEQRTARMRSYFLQAPLARHLAGQHLDVRLTAPDGYQARRSYSIASAPGAAEIELAIELLHDGEVSGYFHDVAQAGDTIEVRGPLGGHFTWHAAQPGAVLLVAGGSGVVPLVSIVRAWAQASALVPTPVAIGLLHSARTREDLAYHDTLQAIAATRRGFDYVTTITRGGPDTAGRYHRRVDRAMIEEVLAARHGLPAVCYVCGANGFVETAAQLLVTAGVAPRAIRTERYGG